MMKQNGSQRVLILCCILLLFVVMGGQAMAQTYNINWLLTTATTGGTYYPVGVGLGTLWTEKLRGDGIRIAATSSAGSGENIEMLRGMEAELAILQGLFGRSVYEGVGMYEGRSYTDLRAMTMLYPNTEHFVLLKEKAPTGNAMDIKGTHFVLGTVGSGTERSTLEIMKGLGLSAEDLRPEHVGYFGAVDLMRDGRVDGASLVAGPPVAAVTEAFAAMDVVILEFTDEQLESIQEKSAYPGFRFVVPAGTYPGQEEDVQTIAQPNYLGLRADLDEEVVYILTKTLFENLDYMHSVHAITQFITLDSALSGLPVPLHAGSMRYFQEQGLEIPDHLIPPEAR